MRDGEPPRICYTDPSGVLRGPFEEWRILEWYRQGFFANTILFNLENSDAQYSLGDLIERFGRDNPFASRLSWQTNRLNGSTSANEQTAKNEGSQQLVCTECRKNGEKLDALLSAVHRMQNALEVNAQNVAENTTAIASLRTMFEESRLSAWKWNSSDINSEPQQKLPVLPSFTDILCKSDSGVVASDSFQKKEDSPEKDTSKENGEGVKIDDKVLSDNWQIKDFVKEKNPVDDLTTPLERNPVKSIQLENLMSNELMKMQVTLPPPEKPDQRQSILERIKKKSNGSLNDKNGHQHFIPTDDTTNDSRITQEELRNVTQQHENDWINANTKPSFHPFPGATTPGMGQPMMTPSGNGGLPTWPGLNTNVGSSPHHMNYNQGRTATPMTSSWGQNSFAPLQMAYRTPAPTPANPTTFAAAALKEKKEVNPQRKVEPEEMGPRLVPVGRNAPRMIQRRAPTNK